MEGQTTSAANSYARFSLPLFKWNFMPRQMTVFPPKLAIQIDRATTSRKGISQIQGRIVRSFNTDRPTTTATAKRRTRTTANSIHIQLSPPENTSARVDQGNA